MLKCVVGGPFVRPIASGVIDVARSPFEIKTSIRYVRRCHAVVVIRFEIGLNGEKCCLTVVVPCIKLFDLVDHI